MTESEIQREIVQYLTERGHLVLRVNQGGKSQRFQAARWWVQRFWTRAGFTSQRAGISDILCLSRGGVFWALDVKAPGGLLSVEQETFMQEVRQRQGHAAAVYSVKDCEKLGL